MGIAHLAQAGVGERWGGREGGVLFTPAREGRWSFGEGGGALAWAGVGKGEIWGGSGLCLSMPETGGGTELPAASQPLAPLGSRGGRPIVPLC